MEIVKILICISYWTNYSVIAGYPTLDTSDLV